MQCIETNLINVFEEEKKVQVEIDKFKEQLDVLFEKKCAVAYDLYTDFLTKNLNSLEQGIIYYYLYIENDKKCLVEKVLYDARGGDEWIEFTHHSIHRRNRTVRMGINVKKSDYENNAAIIDHDMFLKLSKIFKVTVRE